MIDEPCSTSSTKEEEIGCRIRSQLDRLPANLPISLFSLIHDLGFVTDDRDGLISAIRRLAAEGRLLVPHVEDEIELSTPLLSSRLTTGSSTMVDAIMVFGRPAHEAFRDATTTLAYPLRPQHPGRCRPKNDDRPVFGFRLHFDQYGILKRIENFRDRVNVTTT